MTTVEERTAARIAAATEQLSQQRRQASAQDYLYDTSQDKFWSIKDGTLHSRDAVDAAIPMSQWREVPAERTGRPGRPPRNQLVKPHLDIMRVETDQLVESSTWWPGQPQIIKDFLVNKSGLFAAPGRRAYNRYVPPPLHQNGTHLGAVPWTTHVKLLWPKQEEHEYFFDYCAHMLQKPEEKCNGAIVVSGVQGIGKDAALEPLKRAIGIYNCNNIDPDNLFDSFKPWLETLMLVIDEARPSSDEYKASAMYNILKPLTAAPPHVLPMNTKFAQQTYCVNVMRVFITTNHWNDLYIPEDDRRMFVLHSFAEERWYEAKGDPEYFVHYWNWLNHDNGAAHVHDWLSKRDISKFDAKSPVLRTKTRNSISFSYSAADDCVAFALEKLKDPDIFYASELMIDTFDHKHELEQLVKHPRKLTHRMQQSGYRLVQPPKGQARWQFRNGEKLFRSRYAFIKASVILTDKEEAALLHKRGNEIVGKIAAGNVAEFKPRAPEPQF